MFEQKDFSLLHQVDSWERVDEVGAAFFPKLVALKNKVSDLIFSIYGIDSDRFYKTYQAPAPSKKRRKGIEFKPERNSAGATVSFRAKGKPTDLYRPNGKLCEMHFAHLGFSIEYHQDGLALADNSINYELSVIFRPFILRYDKIHRSNLRNAVAAHKIDDIIFDGTILGDAYVSHSVETPVDLLLKEKMWIAANIVDLSKVTDEQMARLVITCAAYFPVLDIFTRQSNGEHLFEGEGEALVPTECVEYREQFINWYSENALDYISNFCVQPIEQEDYWKAESLTRSIFEGLLGCDFCKTRPNWLRTSKNQKSMELDGFNEALKLAFEYHGEYHYSYIFPDQEAPEKIQEKDTKKAQICKMNGIDLIQVPYRFKGDRSYIIEKLRELEREDIDTLLGHRG